MINIHGKNVTVIAEVKTHSPFGWSSQKTWEELFVIAEEVGDIISIHTDIRWNGSFELLKRARQMTDKPILAKGIHVTDDLIVQALEVGADYALVVGRIPGFTVKNYLEKSLIEPLTIAELKKIPSHLKAVWNTRDLQTGGLKKETFAEARAAFDGWLCQASNVRTVEDIQIGADAVLVGTYLEKFAKSIK